MVAGAPNAKPNKCWLLCSRMELRVSQKPEKATEQDKKKRKRKKKTKQTLTHAVTHLRLIEANPGKLAALDQMMAVYLPLCQQYVTWFCTAETAPDNYTDPVFESDLSDRLHRVAIQQAAGIAKSWRSNRQAAYDAYRANRLTWGAKSQSGVNGICPNCVSPVSRPMPTWWSWRSRRTPRSTTGCGFRPWTRATLCESRSNSPPIIKKLWKDARSTPPPPSRSATASGGSPCRLMRTFFCK